ncbi:MAG TPA: M36 family metallopeptidase [Dehalococcoidia bacterium]|nr:M36 family metallopeptidase [Dehalococcoidia bacterium]
MKAVLRAVLLALGVALLVAAGGPAGSQAGSADPVARARAVLAERAPELGINPAALRAEGVRYGLAGPYVRFQDTFDGLPIEGAQTVVGLPGNGSAPVVAGKPGPPAQAGTPRRVTGADALKISLSAAGLSPAMLSGAPTLEEMYLAAGKEAVRGWRVMLPAGPAGTWLAGLRADTGEVLYLTDVRRFDSGRVFNPNPPKNSGGTIPPPTDCDSAGEESVLSSQYQTPALRGRTPGQDQLRGQYADLTAPGILGGYKPAGVASEASGNFIYGCNDDRFEEVMAYYHLDATQRKIQALGFSGQSSIMARPIPVHAHYFNDCNAFYDPANRGLHFGDSDVCTLTTDAAEDADVIVHEYGHAIQDDQVPAWGFGSASAAEQAWAMGEGFSDFITGAVFGDSCLGEWLSFGGACLRDMENSNVYPQDYDACRPAPPKPAEPHCAGLIWGGALWDLAQALGDTPQARDMALTLVLESQFMLDPLATFAEAAAAIRQADQLLFGGAHLATIDGVFAARGISTLGGVSDFPYAYLRIRHTYRGDLDVALLVGSTTSPLCSVQVWDPSVSDPADDLLGYVDLTPANCGAFLPPSAAQPWYLRVRDAYSVDVGTLEEFEVVLAGPQRCIATGLPIAIPDEGDYVYGQVDCSSAVNATPTDDDGDGFSNPVELYVGTDAAAPCGGTGWPADVWSSGPSANKLDVQDLTAFLAPVRRLGTSPGSPGYLIRFDLMPGKGIFAAFINGQDLTRIIVLTPPMFGGQRAFGQTCP